MHESAKVSRGECFLRHNSVGLLYEVGRRVKDWGGRDWGGNGGNGRTDGGTRLVGCWPLPGLPALAVSVGRATMTRRELLWKECQKYRNQIGGRLTGGILACGCAIETTRKGGCYWAIDGTTYICGVSMGQSGVRGGRTWTRIAVVAVTLDVDLFRPPELATVFALGDWST